MDFDMFVDLFFAVSRFVCTKLSIRMLTIVRSFIRPSPARENKDFFPRESRRERAGVFFSQKGAGPPTLKASVRASRSVL